MNAKLAKAVYLFIGLATLSAIRAAGQVQTPTATAANAAPSSGYVCVQRGPGSRVWRQTILQTNSDGDVSTNYQSYTELATGLCFTNAAGQLVDSVEQVESVAGGAQAVQGQYSVQWGLDNGTPVAIQTPEGKALTCQVYGLAYYDLSSGSNAAISRLQDSQGTIAPPNQVVYSQAFSNINADILYTYTSAGLSQDIVFHQAPLAPDAFGLSDSNTVLQVYTQWFNTGEPVATAVTNGNAVDDQVLSFGAMQMNVGNSLFFDGNSNQLSVSPVQKQWVHLNGATYLVESIPWTAISNQVAQLHSASNLKPGRAVRGLAFLDSGSDNNTKQTKGTKEPARKRPTMKVAKADSGGKRFVIDYYLSLSSGSTVTLKGDTTYFVSSTVNVTSQLVVEGGTVVKYTNGGEINITGTGSNIVCLTGPYRMAVFTSMNDNSVGAMISGSSGSPSQAGTYISFSLQSTQSMTLRYLRFCYASTAVSSTVQTNGSGTNWIKFLDCQFYDCDTAISCDSDVNSMPIYVYNVLFSDVTYGIAAVGSNTDLIVSAENVTADNMSYFTYSVSSGNVTATNCIFTDVTNPPASRTACYTNSSGSTIYQPVGGAGYYVTNGGIGATLKNEGTTSIDPGLLADLQTLTTYPPGVISNYITVNSNLGPNVLRNTGKPDIGYHYSPIDWALNVALSNTTVVTLTVSNGTALAGFGQHAISLFENGVFDCNGTATSPIYLVKYNMVQEQSNTNWTNTSTPYYSLVTPPQSDSSAANLSFTELSVFGSDYHVNGFSYGTIPCTISLENCQIYSGAINLVGQTLISSNSLYVRVTNSLSEPPVNSDSNTFANNLFWNGSLAVKHAGSGTWTFRDNLFDQCVITNLTGGSSISNCKSNAYATNLVVLPQLLPGDGAPVILTVSPAYQTGPLGQFYYPSAQTKLIFYGSQSAAAAGLYDFTVTANDVFDGSNTVSIGYHYSTAGVSPDPVITAQPTNKMTTIGGNASFSVTATASQSLTYQWYQNGVLLAGDTLSSLNLTDVTAASAGAYEVVVSDPLGTTASWTATLKVAQNDFFVNYFSSSPINAMIRGGSDQEYYTVAGDPALINGAFPGTGFRGIAMGDDAETYNWMTLFSFGNASMYGTTNWTTLPLTTLQYLEVCATNGETPVLTVNCLGDGYISTNTANYQTNIMGATTNIITNIVTKRLWFTNGTSLTAIEQVASDWVRYCNFIVPNFCWSDGAAAARPGNTNVLTANDNYILSMLASNWNYGSSPTSSPVLLPYPFTGISNLPTVKYWEIGNEMDGTVNGRAANQTNSPYYYNLTDFTEADYITAYIGITAAMRAVDSNILVGPGFASAFLPGTAGTNNNSIIQPLLGNTSVHYDFMVHHPYPFSVGTNWASTNIQALETSLYDIWSWQDVTRNAFYTALVASNGNFNVHLLATEWNGDDSTTDAGFAGSMWTLLADAETVLSMVRGQQTLDANYYPDTDLSLTASCWPLIFGRFQTNLGDMYLSSSFGDGVPALDYPTVNSSLPGSSESPFRVYSTLDTNSGTISVWMLNFDDSNNHTVDLHFPAAISSGTLFTLGNSNIAPSLFNESVYNGTNIVWYTNSISSSSGSSMVETIPPATLMVAQVALASTPVQAAVPVITGFPPMGQPGQIITITGNNFSPNAQQNVVRFGPVRGTVSGASATSLSVVVPFGAAYGPVTVTVSNLTVYSTNYFNPAYYGASMTNPIVMQAVLTNSLANPIAGNNMALVDMGLMDINGDGKPDLMFMGGYASNPITNLGSATLYVNGSSGTGNFSLMTNSPFTQPATYSPGRMAFGDFDGDGLPDWTWVNDYEIMVCGNTSAPQTNQSSRFNQYLTGNGPWGIAVADFDGDGKPDIVVANETDGTVSVYRNLSSGTGNLVFAQKVDFPACAVAAYVAVGDFNGDGRPDIAVVGHAATGTTVVILTNACTPGMINFSSPIAIASLIEPDGIAVGDFNMDGKLDIAVSSAGGSFQGVYVYTNSSTIGNVSFGSLPVLAIPGPYGLAVGDLNGDGLPDIAVANVGNNAVSVFRNTGSGTFVLATDCFLPSSADPICVTIGDLDGDGRPDFAVGNGATTNMVIFQNASQY